MKLSNIHQHYIRFKSFLTLNHSNNPNTHTHTTNNHMNINRMDESFVNCGASTTFVISSDRITIDSMKNVDFENNNNKDFDELNAIESDKKIEKKMDCFGFEFGSIIKKEIDALFGGINIIRNNKETKYDLFGGIESDKIYSNSKNDLFGGINIIRNNKETKYEIPNEQLKLSYTMAMHNMNFGYKNDEWILSNYNSDYGSK